MTNTDVAERLSKLAAGDAVVFDVCSRPCAIVGFDTSQRGIRADKCPCDAQRPWHPQGILAIPVGALMAVIGIQAALHEHDHTHEGCHLDISMSESATWLLSGSDVQVNGQPVDFPTDLTAACISVRTAGGWPSRRRTRARGVHYALGSGSRTWSHSALVGRPVGGHRGRVASVLSRDPRRTGSPSSGRREPPSWPQPWRRAAGRSSTARPEHSASSRRRDGSPQPDPDTRDAEGERPSLSSALSSAPLADTRRTY